MPHFDVQAVGLKTGHGAAFDYIVDPAKLAAWTHAFKWVENGRAALVTPKGSLDIGLEVRASRDHGTVDWIMTLPDGTRATAYSRVVEDGRDQSIYTFVLKAPPADLEQREGSLAEQSKILREELRRLQMLLSAR